MVLPPPAPQNEAEGVQAGKDTPKFEFAQNPTRIHPDATRHPITKRFQGKY